MRIISGISKGRKLLPPKGKTLRPTSDRVKESIFNILGNEVKGKIVLDLFAGTGNLGIEALSRGAKRAVFVEEEKQALDLIKKNLSRCGMESEADILPGDVERAIAVLKDRGQSFDLIVMDPPYEKGLIQRTLKKLSSIKIHHQESILVIEHNRREPLPDPIEGWEVVRQRKIGDTVLSFLTPAGRAKGDHSWEGRTR
jgi:16S rRNA (guanine966-N2)-methyltransferase